MRIRLAIALTVIVIGLSGCGGKTAEQKGAATASDPQVSAEVTVEELIAAYENDPKAADQKYGGKRIRVKGKVDSIGVGILGGPAILIGPRGKSGRLVECAVIGEAEARLAAFNRADRVALVGIVQGSSPNVLLDHCE